MFSKNIKVEGFDDELFNAMEGERRRQEEHIELIASENMASPRVLECQGSVLTNKYVKKLCTFKEGKQLLYLINQIRSKSKN